MDKKRVLHPPEPRKRIRRQERMNKEMFKRLGETRRYRRDSTLVATLKLCAQGGAE